MVKYLTAVFIKYIGINCDDVNMVVVGRGEVAGGVVGG